MPTMTVQKYLESSLSRLKDPPELPKPDVANAPEALIEGLFKLATSKKFRKYSLTPEYAGPYQGRHCRKRARQTAD